MVNSAMRRALADSLQHVLTGGNLPHTPYIYQSQTLGSLSTWLMKSDASRAHICHATGLGKTVEFSIIVRACEDLQVLVVEPSKQLVSQTAKELLHYATGSIAHASSLSGIADPEGNVVVPHWQSNQHDLVVTTDESLKSKAPEFQSKLRPDLVICDECHWLYTEAGQQALAMFPEAIILGFTATPDYLTTVAKPNYVSVTLDNGQVLYCPPDKMARVHFGDLIDERNVRWGIQNNWLAPLAWGQIGFKFSLEDVPAVETPGGQDYDPKVLAEVMRKNWHLVIDVIRKLYKTNQYDLINRYSAAVCPGVDEALEIAQALRSIGVRAECIIGSTSDTTRERILNTGKRGELQFLSSVFVLREGWNDRRVEIAMMLRPTKSRVLYMQFMGRVLRKLAGKVALVLDPHYQNTKFAPLSAPVLFGSPGQQFRSGGLLLGPAKAKVGKVVSPYLHGDLSKLQPVLTIRPLEIEYWAGEDGTFMADGETWATLNGLTSLLGLAYGTVMGRASSCRSRAGRDSIGNSRTFYAVSDVKVACGDLLTGAPKVEVGSGGTFERDGEVWGTVVALKRVLGISPGAISSRLSGCRSVSGKGARGQRRIYYALSDVREACGDLLVNLPQAGTNGLFKHKGETWGSLRGLAIELALSRDIVQARRPKCRTTEGFDSVGRRATFYSLSDMKVACADIHKQKNQK